MPFGPIYTSLMKRLTSSGGQHPDLHEKSSVQNLFTSQQVMWDHDLSLLGLSCLIYEVGTIKVPPISFVMKMMGTMC